MTRIPYFDFYPSDFMHGVRGLSAQEVGVYTMMLCRIYEENGPVEFNTLRLSTYCGMRETTFRTTVEKLVALGKLDLENGRISNRRAEQEISSRANKLKFNSKAGKASAEKRQQKQHQNPTPVQQAFNHTDTDTDIDIITDVIIKNKKKSLKKSDGEPILLAAGVDAQTIADWKAVRRGSITETVAKVFLEKCAKANISPQDAVEKCCERGWTGFEPSWLDPQNRRTGPPKPQTVAQLALQNLREHHDAQRFNDTDALQARAQGNPL